MLTAARDPSAFAETLQSVMSPMSEIDSAPVAKRADALTAAAAAAAEGTSPKAPRGWMVPLVLGALLVALIPVLVVLAYTRHAATRTVVEQEGAPPPAPSAPNVQPR
jgi:cytochrome c-type biogenesis protein CcmH/NrfG